MERTDKPTPEVMGAALAAELAQKQGLQPGNLWEPPMARSLADQLRKGIRYNVLRRLTHLQLGLDDA